MCLCVCLCAVLCVLSRQVGRTEEFPNREDSAECLVLDDLDVVMEDITPHHLRTINVQDLYFVTPLKLMSLCHIVSPLGKIIDYK